MSICIQHLKNKNRLQEISITIAIIGSRKITNADDYGSGAWNIFAPHLTIYGFDADVNACNQANNILQNKQINWQEKHIPLALSKNTGLSTLYVTQSVNCSSLYPPNQAYLQRLTGMKDGIKTDFNIEIETTTLDAFCDQEQIPEIDFLQIDVQGADLDVLLGATKILQKSILGIQIEVEFAALYLNQPLFSDIDIYVRNQGFSLFNLITNDAWCRLPRADSPFHSNKNPGQLLWADALYFRDPIQENAHDVVQNPREIFKLACIADVLDYPDYTLELLGHLTINYGDNPQYNFAQEIVDILSQFPQLVDQGLDNLPIIAKIRHRLNF